MLCWPRIDCSWQRCIGHASAVRGSAVLAVCRLLHIGRASAVRGGTVSAACLFFATALYWPHQQRRHVGHTEPRRVDRMHIKGPKLEIFNFDKAVDTWGQMKNRRITV